MGDDILRKLPRIVPDPALREQREWLMRELMKDDPELHDRVVKPEVDAAVRQERDVTAREAARRALRRVLTLRGLALTSNQDARIDAQTDIDVLNRWHDQAVTAASAEEALA